METFEKFKFRKGGKREFRKGGKRELRAMPSLDRSPIKIRSKVIKEGESIKADKARSDTVETGEISNPKEENYECVI